jgi:hypothetical protein
MQQKKSAVVQAGATCVAPLGSGGPIHDEDNDSFEK